MSKEKSVSSTKYNPEVDGVTATLLQNWLECPQRADWMIRRLTPYYQSNSLVLGTIAHEVLHRVYLSWKKTGAFAGPKEVKGMVDLIGEEYKEKNNLKSSKLQDFEIMLAILDALLPEYFAHWKKKDEKISWVKLEEAFSFSTHAALLRGKMDGAYLNKEKKLGLFETKTKSVINEDQIISTLPLNLQINLYLWVLERLLYKKYGDPVEITYNIIRNPQSKPKAGESLKSFSSRLQDTIATDPKHYFIRYKIHLDRHHVDTFGNELQEILEAFKHWNNSNRHSWKFGMPCINKYGTCPYVPLCYDGDRSPYYVRESLFAELED